MFQKKCNVCLQDKPLTDFYPVTRGSEVRRTYCKACFKSQIQKWKQQNPERYRETARRSNKKNYLKRYLSFAYGLTLEQYHELYRKHNGKCAIYRKQEVISRLSIDHDHKTGKIRGLLCRTCNSGIGLFQESKDLIQKAFLYLEAA